MGANSDRHPPVVLVSHPAWCDPQVCRTYRDHDGDAVYVQHAAIFNGRVGWIAALSQREIFDAAGRSMELDEALVTVRRYGVEEVHLPAGQAQLAGEELRGEVGAMILVALGVLDHAS